MHPNLPQSVVLRDSDSSKPGYRLVVRNSQAAEESLIYAVYKRKPLWDPSVHFYRNNTVVKLLWDEVAQETGLTDIQARTRWKSLRDYYRIELKKINKAGGKGFKKSGWVYFQSMSFLEDLMNNIKSSMEKNSEHSEESLSASEESLEAAESLLSIGHKESKLEGGGRIKSESLITEEDRLVTKVENIEIKWEEQKSPEENDEQVGCSVNELTAGKNESCNVGAGFRNPLKMRPNFDLVHRKLMIQLENRRLELLERSARMEEDDDLLFFRSLLPLLKTLPESRRMWMRLKFQELVCNEIQEHNQNTK